MDIEQFRTQFRQQLNAVLDKPQYKDADGKSFAFFSYRDMARGESNARLGFRVMSPISGGEESRSDFYIYFSNSENGATHEEYFKAAVEEAKKLGVYDNKSEIDDEAVKKYAKIHVKEAATILGEQGMFASVAIVLPSKVVKARTCHIVLNLRPISDIEANKQRYVAQAIKVTIPTGTADIEIVKQKVEVLRATLKELSVEDRVLEVKKDPKKEIPHQWIDLERIQIDHLKGNSFDLRIVWDTHILRIPPISMLMTLPDENLGAKVVIAVKDLIKSRVADNQPISLKIIRDHLLKKQLVLEKAAPTTERRPSDIRDVVTYDGRHHARIYSPTLISPAKSETFSAAIAVGPSPVLHKDVISTFSTRKYIPLATTDRELALTRMVLMQDMVEAALVQHFTDYPEKKFLTEWKIAKAVPHGATAIKYQHDIGASKDIVGKFVSATQMIDLLDRPIDYSRQLMWDVKFEPKDFKDPEGVQIIKFQAVRNWGEALDKNLAPWDKEFEMRADNIEAAKMLRLKLNMHLLGEVDKLFGVDRPVELFGEPSTRMILGSSMDIALKNTPGIRPVEGIVAEVYQQVSAERTNTLSISKL